MKEILKYQELDLELVRLENEMGDNQDRKNAIKMQQLLKDYQAKLVELNKKAKELDAGYTKCKEVFNQMANNVEVINKRIASADEKKIDGLIEANDAVLGNLLKLEKRLTAVSGECANIQSEYNVIMKSARSAKTSLEKYKESYNEAKDNSEKLIASKKQELEKLAKAVDKTLLQKYKQKSDGKAKVFVPEINGRCGGCRMEISVSKQAKLKAEGMIECENCGRVIYSKA